MAKSSEPRKETTRRRTTTPRTRAKGAAEAAAPPTPVDETANPSGTTVPAAVGTPESGTRPESTPVRTEEAPTSRRDGTPAHDAIARRAYEIYQSRGSANGSAMEDWLRAERELGAQRKAS